MRKIAVIVDDMEINREILSDMLEDEYTTVEAENGIQALQIIRDRFEDVAVLLLDLMMPEMDGMTMLAELKKKGWLNRFPILIISSDTAVETEAACLAAGVSDFIKKPFNPALVQHRVNNAVALFEYRYQLEAKVAEQTAELREQAEQLKIQNEKLTNRNRDTIELLGNVVEARNLESGTHVRRVKGFTVILGMEYRRRHPEAGLSEDDVRRFGDASTMHDLGKIMISDGILLKPGKLSPEEFEQMKMHTIYGCRIVEDSKHMWDDDYYRLCLAVCRSHHEKYDGKGYPDALVGDEIPLVAQLVSVADCYDALTTERPYKRPFPPEVAYSMIVNGECGQFNPEIMTCLENCRDEFKQFAYETDGK